MTYTVRQLAKLSGVSVRTLHHYDAIDLLKPAWVGTNGYRYYEEEQLLALQQILFFRELGFKLERIKRLLGRSDFDTIAALRIHKDSLQRDVKRLEQLIGTIDKTIKHLQGEETMAHAEMYEGFDREKQAAYEQYLRDRLGDKVEAKFAECKQNTKGWKKGEWEEARTSGEELWKEFAVALEAGQKPSSPEVQALVKRHHAWLCQFWTPEQQSYIELGELYTEHPDFRKFYAQWHEELAPFLAEAMRHWAKKNLS